MNALTFFLVVAVLSCATAFMPMGVSSRANFGTGKNKSIVY
jgi:hypothetical protein